MQSPPKPTGLPGKSQANAAAPISPALLEAWALGHLERYASSAENLRRVLERRVRRRVGSDGEAVRAAAALIDALIARYRATGLLDDAAYASSRARRGLARGLSRRAIAAGLAAKGVGAEDAAAAMAALRDGRQRPRSRRRLRLCPAAPSRPVSARHADAGRLPTRTRRLRPRRLRAARRRRGFGLRRRGGARGFTRIAMNRSAGVSPTAGPDFS